MDVPTYEIEEKLKNIDDERIFVIAEALRRGISMEEINSITKVDLWFLERYQAIIDTENAIQNAPSLTPELLLKAKEFGFTDSHISFLHKGDDSHAKEIKALRESFGVKPSFKMVDTCAAEFDAETPYYYSTYDQENEAEGRGQRPAQGAGAGQRPHPHRPGHRVRLLLRPLRLGPQEDGLRDHYHQQQPGDRLHRLRHRGQAVL